MAKRNIAAFAFLLCLALTAACALYMVVNPCTPIKRDTIDALLGVNNRCLRAIEQAGIFGAGNYYLSADITAPIKNEKNYTGILTFSTGPATLDLNGHTLTCNGGADVADKPNLSVGVFGNAPLVIYDSKAAGRISGCRYGVKFDGADSRAIGLNLSGNLYAGVWLDAPRGAVIGGIISDIGGVDDEKYATGVFATSEDPLVKRVVFRNIYPQKAYKGDAAGEGLPVNFSSISSGGLMRHTMAINDRLSKNTYCAFMGSGGPHVAEYNICINHDTDFTGDDDDIIRDNIRQNTGP